MIKDKLKSLRLLLGLAAAGVQLGCAAGAAPALGTVECVSCTPWWQLGFESAPANLPPGGKAQIGVVAEDFGDAGLKSSSPLVFSAKVPAGLTLKSVGLRLTLGGDGNAPIFGEIFCKIVGGEAICTVPEEAFELLPQAPYSLIELQLNVEVGSGAQSGEAIEAKISGAGAPAASTSSSIRVSSAPTQFGIAQYALRPENADGSADTQAGSHPFQLTTDIALNQTAERLPAAATKDLHFNLPPGLVGNPTPFPQFPIAKFAAKPGEGVNLCPDSDVIGAVSVTIGEQGGLYRNTYTVPLFALVPSVGEPARFGFELVDIPVYLDTSIRTGGDYGVAVDVDNITELAGFLSSRVTFWGVPGDSRHDPVRGWNCLRSL